MLSTLIKATKNHLKMSFGSFVLLPNITGKFGRLWSETPNTFVQEGALYTDKVMAATLVGGEATNGITYLQFDASRSSSIYSNSVVTVQPSSLIFNYVIKY